MKTVKRRSQKQEKSVAKDFNAKVTVASGALWGMKADVRNDKFLIECKTTEKDYYSLTSKVWEKIEQEAIRDHMRIPLMVIDLEDKDRVVVFRPQDFNPSIDTRCIQREVPKSIRVRAKDLGVDGFGDYTSMIVTHICGKKNNVICLMLQNDFVETFKEELQCQTQD